MASNMKANDPGGGANRLDRLAALALARDQRPVQDEVDQIADVENNQANQKQSCQHGSCCGHT